MTAATGEAVEASKDLLDKVKNGATKVFVEAVDSSSRPDGSSGPPRVLLVPEKRDSKTVKGDVFTVDGLRSTPGRYM
jgi:hypothetical protein